MRPRLVICLARAIAVFGALCPGAAWAGDFAEDGTFVFTADAAVKLSFEPGSPEVEQGGGGEGGSGGGGEGGADPSGAGGAGGGSGAPMGPALDGVTSLAVPAFQGAGVWVTLPPEARTYRVTAWIHGAEAIVDVAIAYDGSVDEVAALYPTGRMTSDGWLEVANDHIPIDGARAPQVYVGAFSAQGAFVDAVELVPDGILGSGARNITCGGPEGGAAVCGVEQVCLHSVCRNVRGWVPPIPENRDEVLAYLRARIELLFGPFLERELDLPRARVSLERAANAEDAYTYWSSIFLAIRQLHDGHTSTSNIASFSLRNKKPITACFIEGDADLSHGVAPKDPEYLDVLVSHTGADRNLGLRAGDRLVSVDGRHPIDWARGLIEVHWDISPTSNHRTFAELAETLRGLIARYASEIAVVRCDPVSHVCGALETISIRDLDEVPEGTEIASTSCDNRPLRHLATSPANHQNGEDVFSGILLESNPTERIYGAEWDSMYTSNGTDYVGGPLKAAMAQLRADARGAILDHRTGNGGTILAPSIVWDFAVPAFESDVYLSRPLAELERPTVPESQSIFNRGFDAGYGTVAGGSNPTTIPVAVLLTRDVSASDWFPLGLKGRAPNVRIFAPFETNGAFSTRYMFAYWLSLTYVLATGDTVVADGTWMNGTGVTPDVVVLPKQSDLVAGRDTVFDAALTWVRANVQ